ESRLEKTTRQSRVGSQGLTVFFLIAGGIGVYCLQMAASAYGFPAERSEAATSVSSNHGWFSSSLTHFWPTAPVAPSNPTAILAVIATSCCGTAAQPRERESCLPR